VTTNQRARSLQWLDPDRVETPATLTPDEAMGYLHDQVGDAARRLLSRAGDLTEALGYERLALTLAAAVMREVGLTAQEYRDRFADERPRQPDTVATACSIAVASADGWPPVGAAGPLLSVLALLGPYGIAPEILESDAVVTHLHELLHREVSAGDIHDVLLTLHQFGLARVRLVGPHRVIHVSDEVQRAVQHNLRPAELARIAWICADALAQCWPTMVADIDLDLLRALRSAHALRSHAGSRLMTREIGCHPLLSLVGHSLGRAGLPTDACTYLRSLARHAAHVLGADHPDTLRIRAYAASWLGKTRDWHGTLAEFTKLLDDYRRVLGDDHPDTLATRASCATYLARTGEVTAAIAELGTVLQARMSLLGSHHLDTLVTRARLAGWRGRAGQVDEAVTELVGVLADFAAHHSGEISHIFRSRASLATWRGHAGDPAAAAAGHRANLTEMLRTYGTDNPDTLVTRKTLLYWYEMAGEHASAKTARAELDTQCRIVLERYEDIVGADHPDVRALKATLASAASSGRARAASVAELRALLAVQERAAGPLHPDTLAMRSELASLIGHTGDPAGAVAELRNLLEQTEPALGPRNPEILKAFARMASWQGRASDPAGAVRTLQELLDRQVQALGPRHHHVRTTLSNLAQQHSANGNQLAAGEALFALLAHRRRRLHASEHEILRTWQRVVLWRAECGQTTTVVEQLRRTAARLSTSVGQWHPDTLVARFQTARWLWKTGHRRRAERELDRLLKDQTDHLGPRHPQVTRSRNLLKQWSANPEPTRRPAPRAFRNTATIQLPPSANTWDRPVGALARLVHSSRAAGTLLETLALCSAEPVTRRVWLAMANGLSATALITDSDVASLLADTGPYITTEPADDDIGYRIDADLGRRVLTRAAGRTGLGPLDVVLRQRALTRALLAQFPSDSPVYGYAARNLPRHAVAGECLGLLTRPVILDHLDLNVLTEVAWRVWLSGAPLPRELSEVLQIHDLLAEASPADRATVRGVVRPQRASQPDALPPTWTIAWSQRSSDPTHLTLVSRSAGDAPRRDALCWDDVRWDSDEIRVITSVRRWGRNLVIVGRGSGELELWDTGTGRRVRSDMYGPENLVALDVAVLGDVQVLAAIGGQHGWLWNLADESRWGDPLPDVESGICAAGFVQRGQRFSVIALAEGSGHLTLWDPVAGPVVDRSIARLDQPISSMCTFASRRRVGECVGVVSGHITTWETDPLRLTDVTVPADHGAVTSMAAVVSEGSTRLWVGGEDGHIAIYDPYSGQRHDLIRAHDGPVLALETMQLTDANSLVASGGADGTVRLWDPQPCNGSGVTSTGTLTGPGAKVHALAMPRQHGPQRIASADADGKVRLWNLKRVQHPPTQPVDQDHAVTTIATAGLDEPSNLCLVTGHRNGMLQRHNLATGEPAGEPVCEHPSPVQIVVELSVPQGRSRLATVDADNTVRLWDLGRPAPSVWPKMIAELPCPDARVHTIVAVKRGDDALVAVGDSTGVVRVWDGLQGDPPPTRAHAGAVTSMLFGEFGDGTLRLVTGGSDQMIRFWVVGNYGDTLTEDGPAIKCGSAAVNALGGSCETVSAGQGRALGGSGGFYPTGDHWLPQ
jgi:WD40 repeat protein